MGSLEDFEKVYFEKNYIHMAIAVLGHFDPKWLFLPKLTLGPKAPPRGKQLTIYFSICTQNARQIYATVPGTIYFTRQNTWNRVA